MLRDHCCNHTTGRGNVNLVESRKTIGRCPINSSTDFQNGQLFLHYKLVAKSCHSLTLLTKVITIKKANFWYPFQLSIQHSSGLKGQEDKCEVSHWVPTGFWRIEVPQPFQGHDKPLGPHKEMPSMVVWCSNIPTWWCGWIQLMIWTTFAEQLPFKGLQAPCATRHCIQECF